MERTRVAKDGTDCLMVIRISISVVSEALLISIPSYGCNPDSTNMKFTNHSIRKTVRKLQKPGVSNDKSSLPSMAMLFIYVSIVRIPTGCEEYHTSSQGALGKEAQCLSDSGRLDTSNSMNLTGHRSPP